MKIFGKKTLSNAERDKMCLQASSMQMEGEKLRGANDLAGAIRSYEKSLDLFRQANEPIGEARILQGLGMLHRDSKHFQEAENYFNQALQIFHDMHDTYRQGTTYDRMGTLYFQMGDNRQAISMYLKATELLLEVGNPQEALDALVSAGSLESREANYENAERIQRRALAIAQENQLHENESQASYHLGYTLGKLDRDTESVQHFQHVLHIYRKTGYEGFAPYAQEELKNLGALDEAQTPARSKSAHAEITSALKFYEQGQPQKAIDRLLTLISNFEALRDWSNAAHAYEALGEIHNSLGQIPEALDKYQKASELYQRSESKDDIARITLRIETILQEMQDFEL